MSATGAANTPGAVSTRHNAQGVTQDLTVGIQKSLNGVFQTVVLSVVVILDALIPLLLKRVGANNRSGGMSVMNVKL